MSDHSSKRKRNYYNPSSAKRKQYVLEAGIRGFMCSCNNREKDCVRESYNLLNTYADKILEKENPTSTKEENVGDSEDISEELAKEVEALKGEHTKSSIRRFQVVESGAKNVVFIRTTVEDPVSLAKTIIEDIYETKSQKTRFLIRLVPIEIVCKANLEDIKKAAAPLFDKYFSDEPQSFAIVFNYRNNNQVKRDVVIKELAAMVAAKNEKHSVNLKESNLTVIVEIIRGFALLSVVPDFMKYKKYNLIGISEKENAENGKNVEEDIKEGETEVNADGNEDTETTEDKCIETKSD